MTLVHILTPITQKNNETRLIQGIINKSNLKKTTIIASIGQ